jgi:hypothetical protein
MVQVTDATLFASFHGFKKDLRDLTYFWNIFDIFLTFLWHILTIFFVTEKPEKRTGRSRSNKIKRAFSFLHGHGRDIIRDKVFFYLNDYSMYVYYYMYMYTLVQKVTSRQPYNYWLPWYCPRRTSTKVWSSLSDNICGCPGGLHKDEERASKVPLLPTSCWKRRKEHRFASYYYYWELLLDGLRK